MLVDYLTKVVDNLIAVVDLTLVLQVDRVAAVSALTHSVAVTVTLSAARLVNKITKVVITKIVFTNVFKAIISKVVFEVFEVRRPVTGKLTLNTTSRTVKATRSLGTDRLRNTVDDLTVIMSNIIVIKLVPLTTLFIRWKRRLEWGVEDDLYWSGELLLFIHQRSHLSVGNCPIPSIKLCTVLGSW